MYHTIGEIDRSGTDVAEALASKLSTMDAVQVLTIAANVNARLLHYGASDPALHQRLEQDLLHHDLRERLAPQRRNRTADQTVVFTRAALLLLSKVVLGLRSSDARSAFDDRDFGTCVLMANELLQGSRLGSDEQLMLASIANWSLYAPLHMQQIIPRFRLIVDRLFGSTHPAVSRARELLNLVDVRFDGMSHDEFQAVLFAVYLIVSKAISDEKAPVLTIEPPLPGFTNEERVRALFALRSQSLDTFTEWKHGTWRPEELPTLLRDDFFLQDVTALRQRPMIRLEERFLLPDYQLALERLTFGAYWTLFDNFTGDDRKLFSGAWGHAFEEYVLDLLADTYPRGNTVAAVFRPNVPLPPREIDGVLDFGDHAIVMEVKSTLLPVEIRSALDLARFDAWVEERLWGKNGGLKQLVHDVAAVRDGLLGSPCRNVYPVWVTDEPAFQALGVNRYLGRAFAERFPNDDAVKPLSIVTTDELEEVLSCTRSGLVTWRGVLDRRATDRAGWLWTGQALRNELLANQRHRDMRLHPMLAREYRDFLRHVGVEERRPD